MNSLSIMMENHNAFMREKKEIERLRSMEIVARKESEVSMAGRGKWNSDAIKTFCNKAQETIKPGQIWEIPVKEFLTEFYSGSGLKSSVGYIVKQRISKMLDEMKIKHHAVQKANTHVYVKMG